MLNFIAFIMCIAAGIWQIHNGDTGLGLIGFVLAAVNLPFLIMWLKELFEQKWGEKLYKKYIEELKNGKQIRIKYNIRWYDGLEDEGWWSEELWIYDSALNLFKCYYPVSSYSKDYCSTHNQYDAEFIIKESIKEFREDYGDSFVTSIATEERNGEYA